MAPSTWTALKRAADAEGMSVADFVRAAVHYTLGVRAGIAIATHDEGGATGATDLVLSVIGVERRVEQRPVEHERRGANGL